MTDRITANLPSRDVAATEAFYPRPGTAKLRQMNRRDAGEVA